MDEYEAIQSQAIIFKSLSGIAHNMALKCAVDLRLADILHSHSVPITLSQLASSIDSPTPPDISALKRVMRLLVRDKIFSSHELSNSTGETLYGFTKVSSLLLSDSDTSMFPILSLFMHPMMVRVWFHLSESVKGEGGTGFEKAHGCNLYEFASKDSKFNDIFNYAMLTHTKMLEKPLVDKYKEVFDQNVGSLVDVGGRIGEALSVIVKEFPHIKGTNFDLPHVVSTAPEYNGVAHFGGNMFESIPKSDAILLKRILHNWSDKDCIKIFKNCKEGIPEKEGKIVIGEAIVDPEGNRDVDEMNSFLDLSMLVLHGGSERTEIQWKKLLEDAGFPRYRFIYVSPLFSLIEAYPE